MAKKIFTAIWILIVVIVIAAIITAFIYMRRAPTIISEALSKKFNTVVTVEDVNFSWSKLTIKGLVIRNPPKSILSKALSVKTIEIKVPLIDFLKHNIVIDEITLDDIYLGLEFDNAEGPTGNWTRLTGNLFSAIDEDTKKESDRSLLIKRIVLTNINTEVVYRTKPKKIHTIPTVKELVFTDISSEGGFPTDQIMNSVLGQMLYSIFIKENLKNMLIDLLNPKKTIKSILSPFKALIP